MFAKNPPVSQNPSAPAVQMTDLARHDPVAPSAGLQTSKPLDDEGPSYPWGTEIDLQPETLERMNLAAVPAVGSKVGISANAHIKSHSIDHQGKPRVTLQLTHLGVHAPHPTPPKAKGKLAKARTMKEGSKAEEAGETPAFEAKEDEATEKVAVKRHVRSLPKKGT